MGKFDGVLLVTDLDGTLLRDDKSVSAENLRAIEYFKSEGGLFTFVTGRVPQGALPAYEQVLPNAPCGCSNGSCIYDYRTGELLWHRELSRSVLQIVADVDREFPTVGIELCAFDKIYFCKKNESTERHRRNERFPDLSCHYSEVDEPLGKILFAESDSAIFQRLMTWLPTHPLAGEFSLVRSDAEYYEILPKGACKGELIPKLAELLHISPHRIIAVGDNENDVSMLRAAEIGIAVANAFDVTKAAADRVTVSNEQHAIAHIIHELDCGDITL